MIRIVEDATRLLLDSDSASQLETLEQVFRFRPNGFIFSPRYKEWEYTDGEKGWDGWERPLRILVGRHKAMIDRGRREEVLQACRLHKFKVDTSRLLPRYFKDAILEDIPVDLLAGGLHLDQDQRNCILSWLQAGIGIHKAAVASGKTIMLAGVSAMIRQADPAARFLYLTTSERLVNQSTREMRRFLPKWNISQHGGGKQGLDGQDMVVATVAILWRNFEDLVNQDWFKTFGAVLFDECHRASAASAGKILRQIPAYFRLGCSDSLRQSNPSAYYKIIGLLGPVLQTVAVKPLMDVGRVARPSIYVVRCESWTDQHRDVPFTAALKTPAWVLLDEGWKKAQYLGPVGQLDEQGTPILARRATFNEKRGNWTRTKEQASEIGLHAMEIDGQQFEVESSFCLLHRLYDQAIVRFKPRNDLIVQWAQWYSAKGLPTLIVCTRHLHIIILDTLLKEAGTPPGQVRCLLGDHTSRERDEALAWFTSQPGGPILISPLVKEGVSINELRAGVVADYIADPEVANQIVGRFIRAKSGDNVAEITFFVDYQHPTLRRNSQRMLRNLAQIEGYEFIDPVIQPPAQQRLG